jgi:hypothetical protein
MLQQFTTIGPDMTSPELLQLTRPCRNPAARLTAPQSIGRATRSHAISAAVDWKLRRSGNFYAGFMFSQVNSGLANNFFQRNNIDPTVGLRFRF